MKKNLLKKFFTLALALTLVVPVLAGASMAKADANSLLFDNKQTDIQSSTGLGNTDPRVMAASIIRILLGFLGIIAVIIILWGGFMWMTSAGNETKIDTAKSMIINGFIGLLIILMAYGIATFIIDKLYSATGATG